VSTPSYVRPGFSPPRRFGPRRLWLGLLCLAVVIIGAVVTIPPGARVSDAAVAAPGRSDANFAATTLEAAIAPQMAIKNGTQLGVEKPFCVNGQPSDGNCVAFQLPKVRIVRIPRAPSVGQQAILAKSGATASPPSVAEPEKAQRSAHRRYQSGTQSRREVDWKARGYTSRHQREVGRHDRAFW
jgi:hypothetical protein